MVGGTGALVERSGADAGSCRRIDVCDEVREEARHWTRRSIADWLGYRDASADVSSLSANTGSTPHADVPTDDTASQASDVSSSSGASEDAGDDYLGDADYLYYDEADGKYYEDDGSGSSVKRRLGRLLVRQIANAASETAKQQKKNSTASIDASSAGNSSSTNATAGAASGNSTDVCQWVTDTDVQNSGAGVPLAVSFHLLTGESTRPACAELLTLGG